MKQQHVEDPFISERDSENNIDIFMHYQNRYAPIDNTRGLDYLQRVMEIQPIKSRQVAASCIAMAFSIDQLAAEFEK